MNYTPKDLLKDLMIQSNFSTRMLTDHLPVLQNVMEWHNYSEILHSLLHVEQIAVEMKAFANPSRTVIFRQEQRRLLSFDWPLSDEKCMVNDKILVDEKHEGFIHKIENERVFVSFSVGFFDMNSSSRRVVSHKIRVIPNVVTFRKCHEAIAAVVGTPDYQAILFPQLRSLRRPQPGVGVSFEFINSALNANQKVAVRRIVSSSSSSSSPQPALVLFGPPGTGKTVTLVEAIIQVYKTSDCSKILACAPSNAAADLICERIIRHGEHVDLSQVARIYSLSRDESEIPASLADVKVHNTETHPYLMKRIIVTTFVSASQLRFQSGCWPGFTHVFLDECGQASEPEALIPLMALDLGSVGKTIVLAGDPYQLGSVVHSREAFELGLERSLMLRLMQNHKDVYGDDCSSYLLALTDTYRFSRECLIKVPSRMFYKDRLRVCGDASTALDNLDDLKADFPGGAEFPLVFVKVTHGVCMRCPVTMSCYNEAEAGIVCKYVARLKNTGVSLKDIGVISPYRKQVQLIRNILAQVFGKGNCVKIGSAEQFQGDERRVVIVSTVRSVTSKQANTDSIGFLHCPKRFNVTVSRARALLAIIGNPNLICASPHWKAIYDYCETNLAIVDSK